MTLGLAILGAGRIGQTHARAIGETEDGRLIAVADPVSDAATALAGRYGARVATIAEILANPEVDAVLICTPTDTHADLIEAFAAAGKAVFCEKPIDLSLSRCSACLARVHAAGVPLMLGFQRRFDPDFQALKSSLDAGEIGALEMVSITSRDPSPPPYDYIERSGGLFRDMMIHDFDVARWMLGEEIVAVQAMASCLVDPEIGARGDVDSAQVMLRSTSGRLCMISNSRRASYGYDQRIELHGAKGMLAAGNHHETRLTHGSAAGYRTAPLENFFMSRYARAYAAEIAHFIAAIKAGRAPDIGGEDGRQALILAEAALHSLSEGRAVRPKDIEG